MLEPLTEWFYIGINGYTSWLHEYNVKIVDEKECKKDSSGICGKLSGSDSSCYGDTGGPLVVADPANNNGLTLVGVVDDNYCDSFQTFIRVSQYIDWIKSAIQDSLTCPPPQ